MMAENRRTKVDQKVAISFALVDGKGQNTRDIVVHSRSFLLLTDKEAKSPI